MVNTRQFSGSTYMQDMTKSHTFSAKNQGSTYTPMIGALPKKNPLVLSKILTDFNTVLEKSDISDKTII